MEPQHFANTFSKRVILVRAMDLVSSFHDATSHISRVDPCLMIRFGRLKGLNSCHENISPYASRISPIVTLQSLHPRRECIDMNTFMWLEAIDGRNMTGTVFRSCRVNLTLKIRTLAPIRPSARPFAKEERVVFL